MAAPSTVRLRAGGCVGVADMAGSNRDKCRSRVGRTARSLLERDALGATGNLEVRAKAR
jgi:hypothetical protein